MGLEGQSPAGRLWASPQVLPQGHRVLSTHRWATVTAAEWGLGLWWGQGVSEPGDSGDRQRERVPHAGAGGCQELPQDLPWTPGHQSRVTPGYRWPVGTAPELAALCPQMPSPATSRTKLCVPKPPALCPQPPQPLALLPTSPGPVSLDTTPESQAGDGAAL